MDITIVTFIEKAVSNDVFFFTAERILSNFGVSFSEKMGRSGSSLFKVWLTKRKRADYKHMASCNCCPLCEKLRTHSSRECVDKEFRGWLFQIMA